MEFHRSVKIDIDPEKIQTAITITNLPEFCESIYEVMFDEGASGEINCIWGVFTIHREVINGGVRFTLPGCPNGLAWMVTTGLPPDPECVEVYCSYRGKEPDPDFQDTTFEFMDDWKRGLKKKFS